MGDCKMGFLEVVTNKSALAGAFIVGVLIFIIVMAVLT